MKPTKEQFMRYVELQELGTINMLDAVRGTQLTGLSRESYTNCIRRYRELYREYIEDAQ